MKTPFLLNLAVTCPKCGRELRNMGDGTMWHEIDGALCEFGGRRYECPKLELKEIQRSAATNIRQYLIDFLKAMELAVPPPSGCHHALTFGEIFRLPNTWADGLAIQVNRAGVFTCLFLDEGDLEKSPNDLALDVVSVLAGSK